MVLKKREDLQSLRGIAIIAVVLFHLNTDFFKNGHLGVDIYFVLSGYFIFSILCSKQKRSMYDFYSKRIWRIFPAYYTFLILTTIASYIILYRQEFVEYVKELRQASTFSSNWKGEGKLDEYFNQIEEENYLLHTWSLSVEIQFYLVAPVIAIFLEKTGMLAAICLIIISGSLQCFASTNAGFYFLPCRLWQFLFGYLAVYYKNENIDNINVLSKEIDTEALLDDQSMDGSNKEAEYHSRMSNQIDLSTPTEMSISSASKKVDQQFWGFTTLKSLSAIYMIILILLLNFEEYIFRQRVVITLLASCFVALNSAPYHRIDIIFNNKILYFIGEISYSWYLYHWPFAVFISYFDLSITNEINFAVYILAPFCLAVLSTYFLENPLIKTAENLGRLATAIVAVLPLSIFFSTTCLYLSHAQSSSFYDTLKFANRPPIRLIPPYYHYITTQTVPCTKRPFDKPCFIGDENATDHTLILGDSHGRTAYNAFQTLPQEMFRKRRISLLFKGGCAPFFQCAGKYYFLKSICQEYWAEALRVLPSLNPTKVIISARFITSYHRMLDDVQTADKAAIVFEQCLGSTVQELMRLNISEISLVLPTPEAKERVPNLLRARTQHQNVMELNTERASHVAKTKPVIKIMERMSAACKVCSLLDPANALCDDKICYTISSMQEPIYPLYYDSHHLNDFGAMKMSNIFV